MLERWREMKGVIATSIDTQVRSPNGSFPTPTQKSQCAAENCTMGRHACKVRRLTLLRCLLQAELKAAEDQMKQNRKKLAQETKKLKDVPLADRGKAVGPLLKLYQMEIDSLAKRGNKVRSSTHSFDVCVCALLSSLLFVF